jgi:5,5'-dehydrodivanillate O-demethylase
MGPDPSRAPLLPRWDVLVNTDRPRRILVMPEHDCNWLQIQENTVDSIHSYYLHGQMAQIEGEQSGEAFRNVSKFYNRKIVSYDWRPCDWGIEKVLKYEDAPEIEVRPPLIFPNILRIPEGPRETLHFRVPVDDEHTRIFHVSINALGSAPPVPPDQTPYVYEESPPNYDTYTAKLDNFYRQDRYAWESQGVIADRTHEVLGASDRGIVLYRRMLFEQIDRVERGEEPTIAMVRDPKQNDVITFMPGSLPWEWAEFKAQTIWSDAKEPVG